MPLDPLGAGVQVEDLFDSEVALQVVDEDRLGPRAVAGGSRGVLAELEALEGLDLGAHEEVQGDVEGLGEGDENGRRRQHLARPHTC